MGRVRRYKKIKAIDPFAKGGDCKKGRKIHDLDRNLPPDVKNHQAPRMKARQDGGKRKAKRRLPQWAQDELKETAKREREERSDPLGDNEQPQSKPEIEGKREDESMREFHNRVQGRKTQLLKESFQEHSASRNKKKRYMDDKKRKKKLQKQGLWEEARRRELLDQEDDAEDDRRDGSSAGPGRKLPTTAGDRKPSTGSSGGVNGARSRKARRTDGGDEDTAFLGVERIRFGEVVHAPPNLAKIPKPKGLKDQGKTKSWVRGSTGALHDGAGRRSQLDDSRKHQFNKRGTRETGKMDESPDALRQRQEGVQDYENAQSRQMEEMRQRVQEAYTGLKKRRRAGQTQYIGNDL